MYGIFSLTGTEHPDPTKNPYNTMILITDAGEINMCAASMYTHNNIGSGCLSELQHTSQQHVIRSCSRLLLQVLPQDLPLGAEGGLLARAQVFTLILTWTAAASEAPLSHHRSHGQLVTRPWWRRGPRACASAELSAMMV